MAKAPKPESSSALPEHGPSESVTNSFIHIEVSKKGHQSLETSVQSARVSIILSARDPLTTIEKLEETSPWKARKGEVLDTSPSMFRPMVI